MSATKLIPFDSVSKLPAHLQEFASEGNEFGFSGGSFTHLSIKGKVFTISRGGEKTLVTEPTDPEAPARAIEVVILDSGPKGGAYAKTFYSEGYAEGSSAKPTCYSNDGVAPAADAQDKQASKCALCPQNAKASGATQQNPNAKACKSSKMLAVAPAGQIGDPMLLRVPGASLVKLNEYGQYLAQRRVKSAAVVTKISFDYSKPHQELTFKAVGFVTQEMAKEIAAQRDTKLVKAIIGEISLADLGAEQFDNEFDPPPSAPVLEKPKEAAAPESDDLPSTPRKAVKVEDDEPAKPAAKKPAPKKTVEIEDEEGIDAALDALDFDD